MSVYAMSDLHGCYEKYIAMLKKIRFCDDDTLYILGDVVDRGDGGIKILKDMMNRTNVVPLRGNHDYLAYCMLKCLTRPAGDYYEDLFAEKYALWLYDGGMPTLNAFNELSSREQQKILAYMNSFLIYDELEVGDNKFFLSHTVPEKKRFANFDNLLWQEFIIGEPEYEKTYCKDKYIVTGHTPTELIDKSNSGRIYNKHNHIAIDCGAVFGNPLGCVCLDNLQELYVE